MGKLIDREEEYFSFGRDRDVYDPSEKVYVKLQDI